jgi:hypothetical protein
MATATIYYFTINGVVSGFTSSKWYWNYFYCSIAYTNFKTDTDSKTMTYYRDAAASPDKYGNTYISITLTNGDTLTIPSSYMEVTTSGTTTYVTFDAISYIDDNPNCGLTYEGQTTDNTTEPSTGGVLQWGLKIQGPVKFITLTIDSAEFPYEEFTNENDILTYSGTTAITSYNDITVTTTNGVYTVDDKYISGGNTNGEPSTDDTSVSVDDLSGVEAPDLGDISIEDAASMTITTP